MEPGHPNQYFATTLEGIDRHECVLEAVKILRASWGMQPLQNNFGYDPVHRERGFDGYYF